MHRLLCTLLMFAAVLALGAMAYSAEEAKPPAAGQDLVIKTLPGIVVDTKAKEVRLEGEICRQKAALELFACSQGTREHESVIVTRCKPSHVTFALALLGLKPGKPGFTTEGGAFSPPAGDILDITIKYTAKDGTKVEAPAWKFLRLGGAEEGLDRAVEWVYVGQAGAEALRAADNEGTVICLSNFREAVIDVPFESTNINSNLVYEANSAVVPPVGTPVEIVIKPTGKRIEPKKVEIEVVVRKGQPLTLDGKATEPAALKDACNAMPAEIRTAVLRADADERFGRIMEIHDILRDSLMQVRLVVLQATPAAAPAKPAGPPVEVAVSADDKVTVGGKTMSVEEFRAKAGDLLKGAERVNLKVDAKTSAKTVAEVMSAARDLGARVTIIHAEAAK